MTSRHLFIAGTGRAGTSFLVRYLTALGLDTHLARHGEDGWNEEAHAGLENVPLPGRAGDLPYVVKSPWFYEFVDEVLANPQIALDAVIIPVRDLAEAAVSRSVLELRAMHASTPWMATLERSWESWGHTPGGVVYSVNPLDQARLLAVGFHKVIERLVQAEIPILFLAFPRMVVDAEYLYRVLKPVLPAGMTKDAAVDAHMRLADPEKVRVGAELAVASSPQPIIAYESHETVDRIALRREIARLRGLVEKTEGALAESGQELDRLREQHEKTEGALTESGRELDRLREQHEKTEGALTESGRELDRLREQHEKTEGALTALRHEADYLRSAIDIIRRSSSWRITRPWRAVGGMLRRRAG
jgi:hypothetical protein